MSETRQEIRLSSGEEPDLVEYRALSMWAVLGLIAGICSFLAIFSLKLFALPVLALVLSVAALRAMADPQARLSGRGAAVCGLVLALMFGTAGPVRFLSRNLLIEREARSFARGWFSLIAQARLEQAHQLTLAPVRRIEPGRPLEDAYRPESPSQKQLDEFFGFSPQKELKAHASAGRVEFVRTREHVPDRDRDYVDQLWNLHYEQDGQPQTMGVRIVLERTVEPETGQVAWLVNAVRPPVVE